MRLITIGATLASQLTDIPYNPANMHRVLNSLFLTDVDEFEIQNCINHLKTNKGPGIDGITTRLLK